MQARLYRTFHLSLKARLPTSATGRFQSWASVPRADVGHPVRKAVAGDVSYGWKPALAMVANLRVGGGTIDVGVSPESERDNGVLTSWIADFYRT